MPPTSVCPVRGSDQNVSDTKLCHDLSLQAENFFKFSIFHISLKTRFAYIQKYFSSIRNTGSCAVPENSTVSFSRIQHF